MDEPTSEGKHKIDFWRSQAAKLARAEGDVVNCKRDYIAATDDLGKWLCPEDAEPGERLCVWYGDSLIQASRNIGEPGFSVTIRKRGKSLV